MDGLEQLGVEASAMAYDRNQPEGTPAEVHEHSSRAATQFMDQTQTSSKFACFFQGSY